MGNKKRKPSHPGAVLKGLYLEPLGLTITDLSSAIGVSRKAISAIVNERKSVTAEMAVRLGRFFDTTPNVWLNLQQKYDLWKVFNDRTLAEIRPYGDLHAQD